MATTRFISAIISRFVCICTTFTSNYTNNATLVLAWHPNALPSAMIGRSGTVLVEISRVIGPACVERGPGTAQIRRDCRIADPILSVTEQSDLDLQLGISLPQCISYAASGIAMLSTFTVAIESLLGL
ncbi:unnamed protein product [Zymoseptoria tritici ST99CH_1A5]|uniref:Uncharacterized protein n=1 Tax=Zymoseptoria tritici ST99CH_1A5 TaxID=1276529 RepID=A0A1Y6M091_ZYMTR|nr:unnamed protein product [Zymoseptoria tritici ST99CH_1A5]